jgi:LAGLIDADG endonuclease
MVHPMWRHVDQVNYNGPKVRKSRAHAVSNGSARIRLYAGKSGESGGTRNMSDNPTGADNQQESLSPAWVVGFVDGEGCFFVGINRQPTMRVGWQVLPEFRVVQHERDVAILEQLREFFECGQITRNHGDRKELRIRGLRELSERVVPFFAANPLRTVKRSSFDCFAEVIRLMQRGEHLTMEGLARIKELASRMNRGTQNPQRPYAGSPARAGE